MIVAHGSSCPGRCAHSSCLISFPACASPGVPSTRRIGDVILQLGTRFAWPNSVRNSLAICFRVRQRRAGPRIFFGRFWYVADSRTLKRRSGVAQAARAGAQTHPCPCEVRAGREQQCMSQTCVDRIDLALDHLEPQSVGSYLGQALRIQVLADRSAAPRKWQPTFVAQVPNSKQQPS